MSTHLLKPGLIDELQLRCGARVDAVPGDHITADSAVDRVDCLDCLRALVVELRRAAIESTGVPEKYAKWLAGTDTGISSMTIWHVMTGLPVSCRPDIPVDPSDFGRCHRMLDKFPEWRARMHEVAAKFPSWKPLVDAWDELTGMYEEAAAKNDGRAMYERMKELVANHTPTGGTP